MKRHQLNIRVGTDLLNALKAKAATDKAKIAVIVAHELFGDYALLNFPEKILNNTAPQG